MYVSLPKELEDKVKERVDSGQYGSASEVVMEALRLFLHSAEEMEISTDEGTRIREIAQPRLESVKNGTAVTQDFDAACEEIKKEVFDA
ncbi:type II toxin-antitoxin system ParD family antitoxin [bacterium]|nr:type II toxin-antitoxin system ParD family antitoxin [bacterium]